jgi:F0F1-type ATP synthase membrane subunit c/vacuolar-type H+-ATPase subunit K
MGLESLMEKVIAESDNGKSKKDTERKAWTEEDWNTHFEKKEAILRSRNKWNNILGKVFLGWIILCAFWIFGLGIYKVIVKHGWYYFMIHLLIGIGLVAAFVGLIWLLIEKSEKIGNWFRNLAIVNIIGGMISATYHKACPMIQWERIEDTEISQEEYEY